jgi:hypothetical protein
MARNRSVHAKFFPQLVFGPQLHAGVVLICSPETGPMITRKGEGLIHHRARESGEEMAMKKSRFTEEQIAFALRQSETHARILLQADVTKQGWGWTDHAFR